MKYLLNFHTLSATQLAGFVLICISFATYMYFMIFMYRTAKPELKEEIVKLATNAKPRRRKNIVGGAAGLQYVQSNSNDVDLSATSPSQSSPSRVRGRTKSVIDVMLSKELLLMDDSEIGSVWVPERLDDNEDGKDMEHAAPSSRRTSLEFMNMNWDDVVKDPEDIAPPDDDEDDDCDEKDAEEEYEDPGALSSQEHVGALARGSSPVDDRLKRLSGRRYSLSLGVVNEIDEILKGKDGLLNDKRSSSLLSKLFGMLPEEPMKIVDSPSRGPSPVLEYGTTIQIDDVGFCENDFLEEWEKLSGPAVTKQVSFEKVTSSRRVSFAVPAASLPPDLEECTEISQIADDAAPSPPGVLRKTSSLSITSTEILNNPIMTKSVTSIHLCGQVFESDTLTLLVTSLGQLSLALRELVLRSCSLRDFEAALVARCLMGNEVTSFNWLVLKV
jgi:hypothetical protein